MFVVYCSYSFICVISSDVCATTIYLPCFSYVLSFLTVCAIFRRVATAVLQRATCSCRDYNGLVSPLVGLIVYYRIYRMYLSACTMSVRTSCHKGRCAAAEENVATQTHFFGGRASMGAGCPHLVTQLRVIRALDRKIRSCSSSLYICTHSPHA